MFETIRFCEKIRSFYSLPSEPTKLIFLGLVFVGKIMAIRLILYTVIVFSNFIWSSWGLNDCEPKEELPSSGRGICSEFML